jgi:hypothetical protein
MALYFSMVHQQGTIRVVDYLRSVYVDNVCSAKASLATILDSVLYLLRDIQAEFRSVV